MLAGRKYKMMGGSETVSGDKDGVHTTAIHVPIGWQRRVEGGQVIYVRWVGSVRDAHKSFICKFKSSLKSLRGKSKSKLKSLMVVMSVL